MPAVPDGATGAPTGIFPPCASSGTAPGHLGRAVPSRARQTAGSAVILDTDGSEFRADVVRYREWVTRSTLDETIHDRPAEASRIKSRSSLREVQVC